MKLFRAKIQGTNDWIKGYPHSVYGDGIDSIQDANNSKRIEYIQIDTLSQFVEISRQIFCDGDIVKCNNRIKNKVLLIKFCIDGYFAGGDRLSKVLKYNDLEIIGNQFDNGYLLEQKAS